MADREALRDAERLLAEAETLAGAIAREIAEMEAALRGTEEDLTRTKVAARKACDHLRWLGGQLESGREVEGALGVELTKLAEIERRLRASISAGGVQPSALADSSADGNALPRVVAALPVFRRTTRSEIERVELRPALTHPKVWRQVAEDHPALGDLLEEAQEQLEEAAKLADSRLAEAERFRQESAHLRATAPKTPELSKDR